VYRRVDPAIVEVEADRAGAHARELLLAGDGIGSLDQFNRRLLAGGRNAPDQVNQRPAQAFEHAAQV
jgi:hypothetical protein